MTSGLQYLFACLLVLALTLSCCQAQRVCDQLSAGGYTYGLSSLGTITAATLFSIPGYVAASINFCGPANGCKGAYACLSGASSQALVLCNGPPTGAFINASSPQLGATFQCTVTGSSGATTVLKGFVGCGPSMANMAALYTPNPSGSGVSSYNFVVPAEVYCDGSGYSA